CAAVEKVPTERSSAIVKSEKTLRAVYFTLISPGMRIPFLRQRRFFPSDHARRQPNYHREDRNATHSTSSFVQYDYYVKSREHPIAPRIQTCRIRLLFPRLIVSVCSDNPRKMRAC